MHGRTVRAMTVAAAVALTGAVAAGCSSGASQSASTTTSGRPAASTTPSGSTTTVAAPTVGTQVKAAALSVLSVVDQSHAFALIGPRFYAPATGAVGVAETVDGGVTWTAVAAQRALRPLAWESGLVFATARRGWAWQSGSSVGGTGGPAPSAQPLMTTDDGGHTWRSVPGITGVEQVLPVGQSVWVVTQPGATGAASAPVVLWTSTDGGGTWTRSGSTPPPVRSVVRVTATTAYGLGQNGIVTTTDGGASWTTVGTVPCPQAAAGPALPLMAAGGTGDLWVVCPGQPGAGNQAKQLYRSTDGGAHWHLAASVPLSSGSSTAVLGHLPGSGYVQQLTALSPTGAVMALDRAGLAVATDGGADWTTVGSPAQAVVVSVLPSGTGLALLDGSPWRTVDGVHWTSAG